MNNLEFEALNDINKVEKVITIDMLKDKSDRTLLYGYDCDRNTHHVYIEGGRIYIYSYNSREVIKLTSEDNIKENYQYIPDKRLYPETCDFEFCKLLMEFGIHLPFTGWHDREVKKYYGEICS